VHECTVALPDSAISEASIAEIEERFHARHEALYTYAERDGGVPELINLAVTALGRVPEIRLPELPASNGEQPAGGKRLVYFPELGGAVETPIFAGTTLASGVRLEGPAIVEEPSTTVVVYPGWRLELDPRSFYVMTAQ